MHIRSERQKGLNYVELGRKYHMDPRTAKRYAELPQKPEYTLSEPKPTKMAPYKQIVDEWLEEAPYLARGWEVEKAVLFSHDTGVLKDAVHRICHRYGAVDKVPEI
ncbi:hypothetical protein [Oscillibacter sp. CU971]|uniref:hypothetical protein n=1 Tax=Oscillibacter sp. CU971 TaxID=2780102 RepID=UPI00195DAC86|nr:hypothetical protein [Oscillibacter sp. CU971]